MKSLISMGPRRLEFGEWEEPSISPGQVLIEVAECGSCGTDLHVYTGLPATWPVPGIRVHEIAGNVIAWAIELLASGETIVDPMISEMSLEKELPHLKHWPAIPGNDRSDIGALA